MRGAKVAAVQNPYLLKTLQRHVFHCFRCEFKLAVLAFKALHDLAQCISPDHLLPLREGCFVLQPF